MSGEFGTGKTIFVLAIVVGCFAVLWPKIFYPMLTASVKQPATARQVQWRDEANLHFLDQLCYLLEEHYAAGAPLANTAAPPSPSISGSRWSADECWQTIWRTCGQDMNETLIEDVRLGRDKSNLTECLSSQYGLTAALVASAAPPKVRLRHYLSQTHARPERPPHLHPEMMHPALREKGRAMPQRTIDKQARPGPMPGIRPPMGGAGGMVPPPQGKGSGAMGIIMPLYTVGIVVFFVYTIMKVLFKKGQDDDKTPKLKDFHLDPEYRKYVFAEEYLDNAEYSSRDQIRRQAREDSRSRRKAQQDQQPDTKIEDEQLDHLRRRLEETEKAMERLMCQMGSVTDKLTAAKITEVLSQAQAQAKILKDEVGDITSEEDLTSSEALTTTMSEDNSLPTSLQQHLQGLQVEQLTTYSELSVDEVPQLEGEQVQSTLMEAHLDLLTDDGEAEAISSRQKEVTVDLTPCQTTVDTVASFEEVEVEALDPQVNVDAPQSDDVHLSNVSLEQTDNATEECVVEDDHGADKEVEQVIAPSDIEKGHVEEITQEEAQGESVPQEVTIDEVSKEKEITLAEQQIDSHEVQSVDSKQSEGPVEKQVDIESSLPAEGEKELEVVSITPEEPDEIQTQPLITPEEPEQKQSELVLTSGEHEQKHAEILVTPEEPEQKQTEPSITPEEPELKQTETSVIPEEPEQKQTEPSITPEEPEQKQTETSVTPEEPEQKQTETSVTPEEPEQKQTETSITPEEPEQKQAETSVTPEEPEQKQTETSVTSEEPEQKQTEPSKPEQKQPEPEITPEEPGLEKSKLIPPEEPPQKQTELVKFSEELEQKLSEKEQESGQKPEELLPGATNESTTCMMTFISDTANKLEIPPSKIAQDIVSSGPVEKEDSGTPPDEAEADPLPVVKEPALELHKGSSDDAEGENVEVEESSEATETGADISELKSFAEEGQGQVKSHPIEDVPVLVPVIDSCPSIRMGLIDQSPSEEDVVECKGQGTQTSLALSAPAPAASSKEHSTQTDEEQGVAVLGVQTSFRHDEGGVETRAGSHGPVKPEGITEIVLDALLPSETQLLIKDTQVVGSMPSENVEVDASSADGIPCIVTSHLSLAFVGLERDEVGKAQSSKKNENEASIPSDNKKPSEECIKSAVEKQMENTTLSAESGTDTTLTPPKDIEAQTTHDTQIGQVGKIENKTKEEMPMVSGTKSTEEKNIGETKKSPRETTSILTENKGEAAEENQTISKTSGQIESAVEDLPVETTPDSPSLEAIAEAVVAATTRAALDLLATTNTDTLIKHKDVVSISSASTDTVPCSLPKTKEVQEEPKKSSEDAQDAQESSGQTGSSETQILYVATVTHTPSESPSSTPEKEKTQEAVESEMLAAIPPQDNNEQRPEKVDHSKKTSPAPMPESDPSQTVEAALAEAAEEVCELTVTKGTKHQEAAAQDSQGATTVSPNEESPTSSKGSSPDMEEYEVINKEEGTAQKPSTQRESSGAEPVTDDLKAVKPAATTESSSQPDRLSSNEDSQPEEEAALQIEERDIKTKDRCSPKEPEDQECSSKTTDQEEDPVVTPVDESAKDAESDPAALCTQSVEEVNTHNDSLTSEQTDKVKSE